jgi:hypothetical protein
MRLPRLGFYEVIGPGGAAGAPALAARLGDTDGTAM